MAAIAGEQVHLDKLGRVLNKHEDRTRALQHTVDEVRAYSTHTHTHTHTHTLTHTHTHTHTHKHTHTHTQTYNCMVVV